MHHMILFITIIASKYICIIAVSGVKMACNKNYTSTVHTEMKLFLYITLLEVKVHVFSSFQGSAKESRLRVGKEGFIWNYQYSSFMKSKGGIYFFKCWTTVCFRIPDVKRGEKVCKESKGSKASHTYQQLIII